MNEFNGEDRRTVIHSLMYCGASLHEKEKLNTITDQEKELLQCVRKLFNQTLKNDLDIMGATLEKAFAVNSVNN